MYLQPNSFRDWRRESITDLPVGGRLSTVESPVRRETLQCRSHFQSEPWHMAYRSQFVGTFVRYPLSVNT